MRQGSAKDRSPFKTSAPATAEFEGGEGHVVCGGQPDQRADTGRQLKPLRDAGEPDLIDMHVVLKKTGLSRSSIYRAISFSGFPPAVPMTGRRRLFLRCEVEAWVNARIAKR